MNTVALPVKHDRGHCDLGLRGQAALNRLERGIAGFVSVAMAIGMDYHRDEIWIVERYGAPLERGVVEFPVRGPLLPQEFAQRAAICHKAGAPALSVEVVLVPEAVLLLGRVWLHGSADVLDVI